jgi:hypothetical protein
VSVAQLAVEFFILGSVRDYTICLLDPRPSSDMAKAKPTKHTAAEIAAKAKAANTNMGGGAAGLKDRKGGEAGHSKFLCQHCKTPLTSLVQAKAHHEAKHDKIAFSEGDYTDVHELHGGVTTQGIAVRGTTNAEKIRHKGHGGDE